MKFEYRSWIHTVCTLVELNIEKISEITKAVESSTVHRVHSSTNSFICWLTVKFANEKSLTLAMQAGTWGHWRQYVDLSWTPLWLNFAETGFNPQAAPVSCFYFPGVNSSHSFFILLDILHHDRFSRSLDSWRKLIFHALSEAFMADHRTYTICSGFRTGSLPACWRIYH